MSTRSSSQKAVCSSIDAEGEPGARLSRLTRRALGERQPPGGGEADDVVSQQLVLCCVALDRLQ